MSRSLFKIQNPLHIREISLSLLSIIINRTLASSSSQTTQTKNKNRSKSKNKKPLSIHFDEIIGSREKSESGGETKCKDEFSKGLKELELEVRNLKENDKNQTDASPNVNVNVQQDNNENVKSLDLKSLFDNNGRRGKEEKKVRVFKELSPEMEMFVSHLHKGGYLKKANFLSGDEKELDFSHFKGRYARDFVKSAAALYAKDHQEFAKLLSGKDLKNVALFGCPSLGGKNVFSAKQLRHYFEIKEDTVCCRCALKGSCNFVSKSFSDCKNKNLNLDVVMRIIVLYAFESVPSQLEVPDEVKASVNRLLKEIISLSQTSAKTKIVKNVGLHTLFIDNNRGKEEKLGKQDEPSVLKELSQEMEMFVGHLYKEGYLKKANFLHSCGKELDFSCFNDSYSRDFIKFAAEEYARDHQALAKWLSGSDLKKVVLFGCPSFARRSVFSAKRLRRYFEIKEDTVCSKCMLKDSCENENKIGQNIENNLDLLLVMRVIIPYALESVPPQLAVPDEVKASVHRLLKEIISLSQSNADTENVKIFC